MTFICPKCNTISEKRICTQKHWCSSMQPVWVSMLIGGMYAFIMLFMAGSWFMICMSPAPRSDEIGAWVFVISSTSMFYIVPLWEGVSMIRLAKKYKRVGEPAALLAKQTSWLGWSFLLAFAITFVIGICSYYTEPH